MLVGLRNAENVSRASRFESNAAIVVELEAGGLGPTPYKVVEGVCLAWLKVKGKQVGRHDAKTTAVIEARALRSSAEERAAQKKTASSR